MVASLDALQALCPNLGHVSLVVSWFGDDLRAGHCTIAPRVETPQGDEGADVAVAGLARASARSSRWRAGPPPMAARRRTRASMRLIRT